MGEWIAVVDGKRPDLPDGALIETRVYPSYNNFRGTPFRVEEIDKFSCYWWAKWISHYRLAPVNAGARASVRGRIDRRQSQVPMAPYRRMGHRRKDDIHAALPGDRAAAPAPVCKPARVLVCDIHNVLYSSCMGCLLCVQSRRESAGLGNTRAPTECADAPAGRSDGQSDSHPLRRNAYGLKERYPEPIVSRLVGTLGFNAYKWSRK